MLFSILRNGDIRSAIIQLLLTLPTLLIALTVHEVAHGWVAYKCGDPTAHNMGRLTLNPLKHLDPIGTIMMLIAGFGWARPVPVNSRYFKKPKRDMALTAAAGPAVNLIMGLAGVILYAIVDLAFFRGKLGSLGLWSFGADATLADKIGLVLADLFFIFSYMNTMLGIFNLIPIPPFDGSRIAFVFLPDKVYWGVMKYERIIMIVMLMILISGQGFFSFGAVAEKLIEGEYWLVSLVYH